MILVAAIAAFCLGLPAYADTTDSVFDMYCDNGNGRKAYTEFRLKENRTPVYLTATNQSLPYRGLNIRLQRRVYDSTGKTFIFYSSNSFKINDYREYLVYSSGDHVTGVNHRIEGSYPDTTYSWGSVQGLWSPDSVYYPSLVYLNDFRGDPV